MYKSAHMHTHTPNTCVCVRACSQTPECEQTLQTHTQTPLFPEHQLWFLQVVWWKKKVWFFPMANFNSTWEVELVPPEPAPPGWLRSSWQKQDTPTETVALSHKSELGLQGEGLWHLPVLDYMGLTPQCCSHQCGFLYYFMGWQRRQ